LFQACDCVLFPSRFEPFGGTFAQAWSAKRPLVTTASEGPSQYVTDKQDALVVPIDDIDKLATAMQTVIDQPDLCKTLVENGYKKHQGLFTVETVLEKYNDLYTKVAKL
jgi:glycosyltransferase involved in cell wall biosynthesis